MDARQIMDSSQMTIPHHLTLNEARGVIGGTPWGFLAVVNEANELVGHLSHHHLRWFVGVPVPVPRVAEVMGPGSLFIDEDDEVEEALRLMRDHGTAAIPVVDDCCRVVGTLSYEDALRAAARG